MNATELIRYNDWKSVPAGYEAAAMINAYMKQPHSVDYACPTSETAERLGFGKTGCYMIRHALNGHSDIGFATVEQAEAFVDQCYANDKGGIGSSHDGGSQ